MYRWNDLWLNGYGNMTNRKQPTQMCGTFSGNVVPPSTCSGMAIWPNIRFQSLQLRALVDHGNSSAPDTLEIGELPNHMISARHDVQLFSPRVRFRERNGAQASSQWTAGFSMWLRTNIQIQARFGCSLFHVLVKMDSNLRTSDLIWQVVLNMCLFSPIEMVGWLATSVQRGWNHQPVLVLPLQ